MKTTLLQKLSKEITEGKWATDIDVAVEIIDREGVGSVEMATVYQGEGSGKGSEICALRHDPDNGLDLHDARYKADAKAISLTPQLIMEVLELRNGLRLALGQLEGIKPKSGVQSASLRADIAILRADIAMLRSLLTRHETTN